ncbi:aminodeoxychorismate/anthranilate synthase component II [Pontibacter sp. SGAir0037]|uniref:anthranilate synthase component II n=1 Tax=Pontibacter sp. SGAir0037 TaxID=2571030 RepID=UPI0010CCE4F0|nr:aminodeoxychorismate/anthranilate synthase component II [Pontibacter sp. SGAir0037]QCR24290.1 aminodeoxychorismate/anthranilate synthase component II [Pontibacter sp. SGAir0037]
MLLLLDNFDSFTYNLVDYFGQLGVEAHVLRNDVGLEEIKALPIRAIVLSPGPGAPVQAGCMMELIKHYHKQVPMLGICLGHQALGEFFGATLDKGIKPMHGKLSDITCEPDPIYEGLPKNMPVVRYHSLILKELPDCIIPLAHTKEGELMAFKHQELPLYALQFHPEAALTTYGLDMLRNWVTIANFTD